MIREKPIFQITSLTHEANNTEMVEFTGDHDGVYMVSVTGRNVPKDEPKLKLNLCIDPTLRRRLEGLLSQNVRVTPGNCVMFSRL